MRADIHDGQEPTLQTKAGYIDARPLAANSTKSSCNARPMRLVPVSIYVGMAGKRTFLERA
jgi:hypothetical protein